MKTINPTGPYEIVDLAYVHDKANADDPRRVFAQAILQHRTYEGVLAAIGAMSVIVPSYNARPVTGRMEVLYFRRRGKIADAG